MHVLLSMPFLCSLFLSVCVLTSLSSCFSFCPCLRLASALTASSAGRYIAHSLNHTLRESDVRKLFKQLDEDHSGHLDAKEIRRGLRKLGLPATKVRVGRRVCVCVCMCAGCPCRVPQSSCLLLCQEEVAAMIAVSDKDKSGTVDEEEFVQFVLVHQQQGGTGDWKKLSHHKVVRRAVLMGSLSSLPLCLTSLSLFLSASALVSDFPSLLEDSSLPLQASGRV